LKKPQTTKPTPTQTQPTEVTLGKENTVADSLSRYNNPEEEDVKWQPILPWNRFLVEFGIA